MLTAPGCAGGVVVLTRRACRGEPQVRLVALDLLHHLRQQGHALTGEPAVRITALEPRIAPAPDPQKLSGLCFEHCSCDGMKVKQWGTGRSRKVSLSGFP